MINHQNLSTIPPENYSLFIGKSYLANFLYTLLRSKISSNYNLLINSIPIPIIFFIIIIWLYSCWNTSKVFSLAHLHCWTLSCYIDLNIFKAVIIFIIYNHPLFLFLWADFSCSILNTFPATSFSSSLFFLLHFLLLPLFS